VRQQEEVRGTFTEQLKGVIQKLASRFPWRSRRSSRGDAIHWYASMVGALILARAVNSSINQARQRQDATQAVPNLRGQPAGRMQVATAAPGRLATGPLPAVLESSETF